MNEIEKFELEKEEHIEKMSKDMGLLKKSYEWEIETSKYNYSYNFSWLGRPIIQYPQDIVAMQELIWNVQPDVIVETGIAHGGSIVFYASMLELIGKGTVVGVDIDIRKHNREKIENHPMYKRINLIEGSSIESGTVESVKQYIGPKDKVMVILDSNHTYQHVKRELELYEKLVTKGSYLIVFDTIIEDEPEDFYSEKPWGKGNNPKIAVQNFLKDNKRFVIDKRIEEKLLITVAPSGYLKCIE